MRRLFQAAVASRGLALGRARVREPHRLDVEERKLSEDEVELERQLLSEAMRAARSELNVLRERVRGALSHEVGEFLDLHAMLLDDPELAEGLDQLVRVGRFSAASALRMQRDRLVSVFDTIDDPYMRSRRDDIDHVIGRVYAALHPDPAPQIIGMAGEVLVCENIAPSEVAHMHEEGVVAIITSGGSHLSHSAILARSLHMPLLVGAHEALQHINDGEAVIVDNDGQIIVEPDPDDLKAFREARADQRRERKALSKLRKAPSRTVDGVEIRLWANAESREDVSQAHSLGAAGVGLYRTEFLFLQRGELPSEEEQFLAYRDAVLGMDGRPVTIRTLDLGADKADSTGLAIEDEPNPALGLRGVRLCLAHVGVFREQLRAILRASAYGPLRILVPMVTHVEELLACRRLIVECAQELSKRKVKLSALPSVGAMIEVPAAALAIDTLLPHMDFCSVGTNDLIQYLLAADRGNDALSSIASPSHPAVLRLLAHIFESCRRADKAVAVCGEIAGDPVFTPILLGLGLTDFSMHPSSLLEVRRAIRESDLSALTQQSMASDFALLGRAAKD